MLLRYTSSPAAASSWGLGSPRPFGKPWAASVAEATGGDSVDPLSVLWLSQQDSGTQVQQEGLDGIFSLPGSDLVLSGQRI